MSHRAILLANLGSPDSTSVADVRRYLREFLWDERVLDVSAPIRWLFLEGYLLRTRPRHTAEAYASVWTKEGSPLMATSRSVRDKIAAAIGPECPVYLAMRYGSPSIGEVLRQVRSDGIEELLVVPQYPHYAMSSWETVVARVFEEAAAAPRLRIRCVQPFYADPDYIAALHAVSAPWFARPHDHVLFSYHGLPERHMRKADCSRAHCLKVTDCCRVPSPAHATCYRAQVFATTAALAARAGLKQDRYSISFQSRLVGEPWLGPFTDRELVRLPGSGVRRLLVICPAFTADCLETLEEIAIRGRETFLGSGGQEFSQIPCLNDQAPFIEFLEGRIRRWLSEQSP